MSPSHRRNLPRKSHKTNSYPRQSASTSTGAVLLLALVILSGCGSGAADDQTPAHGEPAVAGQTQRPLVQAALDIEAADPPLSKSQFVTRVNGLCRQAWATIRQDLADYRGAQNRGLSAQRRFRQMIARSLSPKVESQIFDRIMALGTPRRERVEVEEIMRWLGEAIEIGQGEYPVTSPVVVWDLFDMFNPLARRYGLSQCLVNRAHTRLEE
jgi:hypothetical protein